jgi:hypothetical protein
MAKQKTITINLRPVTLRWTDAALAILADIEDGGYDYDAKQIEFGAHFRGQRDNNGVVNERHVIAAMEAS